MQAKDRSRKIIERLKEETGAEALARKNALVIRDYSGAFGANGSSDSAWLIKVIEETADDAISDGFKSLCILREMSPRSASESDCGELTSLERRLKSTVPEIDLTVLCFYDITDLEPVQIIREIQAHPGIIYQGELHDNMYYIPDFSCLKDDGELYVKSMLDNIAANDGTEIYDKKNTWLRDIDIRILKRRLAEYDKTLGIFRESESYFRNLVNAAPVAIIMTDKGGKCLFVNDYWRQLSGLSLQESIGSGWQKVVHREDVGRMGVWWYGRNKRQYGPGTKCRINATDGTVKRVELKSSPFYDDNGTMIGYIAMFAEIGEVPDNENDIVTGRSSRKKETIASKSPVQYPKFPN